MPISARADRLTYCDRAYAALEGADLLAIVTEWQEFRHPDFEVMRRLLSAPVIADGRNLYEPERMQQRGFTYSSIGRATVRPRKNAVWDVKSESCTQPDE